jgi:hypothetical protein
VVDAIWMDGDGGCCCCTDSCGILLMIAITREFGTVRMGSCQNGSTARCLRMLYPYSVLPLSLTVSDSREYLKLPKSTLQTQFAHGAKQNLESDFKFETEYLLDCSIPPTPPGAPIFLKDCLYDYFTNIVQVRRQLFTPAPTPNFSTKPFFPAGGSGFPAYEGDGNGFYGNEKKRVEIVEERNVAAWQV